MAMMFYSHRLIVVKFVPNNFGISFLVVLFNLKPSTNETLGLFCLQEEVEIENS